MTRQEEKGKSLMTQKKGPLSFTGRNNLQRLRDATATDHDGKPTTSIDTSNDNRMTWQRPARWFTIIYSRRIQEGINFQIPPGERRISKLVGSLETEVSKRALMRKYRFPAIVLEQELTRWRISISRPMKNLPESRESHLFALSNEKEG